MKLLWTTVMASVAAVALTACDQRIPLGPTASASEGTPAFAQSASTNTLVRSSSVQTGNGAPRGGHYSLNIIGVPKGKTASMTGDNGHRIFVPLWGNPKIMLREGPDFAVLDAPDVNQWLYHLRPNACRATAVGGRPEWAAPGFSL